MTGSEGELRGVFQDGIIEVTRHGSLEVDRHEVGDDAVGHYGGDQGLLDHFTEAAGRDTAGEGKTSGRRSLESHLLGFAAEQSRLEGRVIEMAKFREVLAFNDD